MTSRNRPLARLANFFIVAVGLVGSAGFAHARSETLQWQHAEPSRVVRFEAEVGTQLGVYDRTFDLGLPTPDASQIYTGTVTVGDQEDVYIVLRALGTDGAWSTRSAFRYRPAPGNPSVPNPTPDPLPSAGSVIDFESSSLGSVVAGWIDTGANHSMQQDDSLFDVLDFTGSRVMHTNSSASNIHSHLIAPGFPTSNYAVRGRMWSDAAGASHGVTVASDYPNSNAYYRLGGTPAAGNYFLISHQGLSLTCSQANTGVLIGDDVWYHFELRVEDLGSQTRLRAKVWPANSGEPGTHQQECVDSSGSRRTSGSVGLWSSGAGNRYWDDIEVIQLAPPTTGGGGTSTPLDPPVLIGIAPVN